MKTQSRSGGRLAGASLLGAVALFAVVSGGPAPRAEAGAATRAVHHGRIDGAIGPITASYLARALRDAAADSAELLVIELDTPGGLDTAMRQMVQAILGSPVPVAVHVRPGGARAASAGVFLLAAAHVAAMAPATNVGAATPVNMGGGLDEAMQAKVTNDAVAYLQGLYRERERAVEWGEKFVREALSVTAEEALREGIIDLMAADLPSLLAGVNGREVSLAGGSRALRTEGAMVVERPFNWRERLLHRITDPTIAYIFLLLGFYGLFFELSNPGSVFPGVVGALCLLLAFLAFQSLPVNYVGVLLILLGLLLLLLEIKIASLGLLTLGGVVALLLGSLLLFDGGGMAGLLPLRVILPSVAVTVLFFALLVGLGLAAQRRRPRTGLDALRDAAGEILRADGPRDGGHEGRVLVQGEIWACRAAHPLRRGDRVRVTGRAAGRLLVEGDAEARGRTA